MPVARRTLATPTAPLSGRGLFSGEPGTVTIRPNPAATGVLLALPGRGPVQASVMRVVDWQPAPWPRPVRNTTIGIGKAGAGSVGTVEHLLSALAGLGVTDAVVDIEGPEVPILDGSALPFVNALKSLMVDTDRVSEPIILRREVEVSDGPGAVVRAVPRTVPGCSCRYELAFAAGGALAPQSVSWDGTPEAYCRDVAPARTFSFRGEAVAAKAAGLFKHFTTADMLVIGDDGHPIDNAWRLADEPARHKLLDLIGDLALLGRPLQADVVATRSGHRLTHAFCRAVLESLA